MHYGEITADMNLWIFGPIPLLNHSVVIRSPYLLYLSHLCSRSFASEDHRGEDGAHDDDDHPQDDTRAGGGDRVDRCRFKFFT